MDRIAIAQHYGFAGSTVRSMVNSPRRGFPGLPMGSRT